MNKSCLVASAFTLLVGAGSPATRAAVVADVARDFRNARVGEPSATINANSGVADTAGSGRLEFLRFTYYGSIGLGIAPRRAEKETNS